MLGTILLVGRFKCVLKQSCYCWKMGRVVASCQLETRLLCCWKQCLLGYSEVRQCDINRYL